MPLAERRRDMKLTDKRFWITWVVVELLILASCIDIAVRCRSIAIIIVFAVSQPLMIYLPLFKISHRNGALVNLTIIGLYTAYSIYLRIAHEDPNGWASFAFAVVIPTVQLILLLLYWGIELLVGAAKRR